MRVALMLTPWTNGAEAFVEANTAAQWRAAIASLPERRYCAAVYVPPDPKPYPVQRFNGRNWPASVTSADGFLVVWTGLRGAKLARDQWAVLNQFPGDLAAWDTQLGAVATNLIDET